VYNQGNTRHVLYFYKIKQDFLTFKKDEVYACVASSFIVEMLTRGTIPVMPYKDLKINTMSSLPKACKIDFTGIEDDFTDNYYIELHKLLFT
jgi:hypothetical protein